MLLSRLSIALLLTGLAGCAAAQSSGAMVPQAAALQAQNEAWVPAEQIAMADDPIEPTDAPVLHTAPGPVPSPDVPVLRWAEVDGGVLYRGGLPSLDALKDFKRIGIKTDIDLMGEIPVYDTYYVNREKKWAAQAGIKFVNVVVPTGKVPGGGHISDAVANAFLAVVNDPANQPCFVHCLHGRDRTGTMCAVFRMTHDHYTNQQAFDEMTGFGFDPKSYPELAAYVQQYKPAP